MQPEASSSFLAGQVQPTAGQGEVSGIQQTEQVKTEKPSEQKQGRNISQHTVLYRRYTKPNSKGVQ